MLNVKTELLGKYCRAREDTRDDEFAAAGLRALGVSYDVSGASLATIPANGPTLVVANHPFGAIEGLVLLDMLAGRRSDCRVVANEILGRIEELQQRLFLVSPYATATASTANVRPLAEAARWLKRGKLLAMFPAGKVAHLRLATGRVEEPPWLPAAAWLARSSGATVVPVFFDGANDWLFQLAGLLHPSLRTALLPRALLLSCHRTIGVRVGEAISPHELATDLDHRECCAMLRERVLLLGQRH